MPEIIYNADQGAGVRKIIRIMQGDTRSHVVRFVVPRYESGVDLAPLVWYIKLVDADGVPDVALPSALYEVTESEIRVRWTVNGVSTDVVGSTKFQLYGAAEDADGHVISWTSGAGEIEVTQNIGFATTEEQEDGMNTLDTLITFVQGELNAVIAAGNSAAAAATSANNAASSANNAASSANAEASAANSAASAANNAAAAANSAAASANAAASIADSKANALTTAFDANPAVIYPDENSILKPVSVLSPVQAGSGDPSPENIRPISGWTGAKLTRCGKNLAGSIKTSTGVSIYGAVLYIDTYLKPKTKYTLSFVGEQGNQFYFNENVFETNPTITATGSLQSITVTTRDNLDKTIPQQYISGYGWVILKNQINQPKANVFTDIQLELGSIATPFEPYQGDTFALDFGQTIYGGRVDWNKGEAKIDIALATLTGEEPISRGSAWVAGTYRIDGVLNNAVPVDGYVTVADIVCSHGIAATPDGLANGYGISKIGVGQGAGTSLFFNFGAQYDNEESAKAYLTAQHAAGTPVQIVYTLANPITIQLTPQLISALSGLNTVYGDGDALEGSYNKSLSAAFEEIKNAILSMGGNV